VKSDFSGELTEQKSPLSDQQQQTLSKMLSEKADTATEATEAQALSSSYKVLFRTAEIPYYLISRNSQFRSKPKRSLLPINTRTTKILSCAQPPGVVILAPAQETARFFVQIRFALTLKLTKPPGTVHRSSPKCYLLYEIFKSHCLPDFIM